MERSHVGGQEFFYTSLGCIYAGCSLLLLPVLIAWLSLRMRWGAFPIGVTVWFIGQWIIGACMVLMANEGATVLMPIIAGITLAGFASDIPRRLEHLAAQE